MLVVLGPRLHELLAVHPHECTVARAYGDDVRDFDHERRVTAEGDHHVMALGDRGGQRGEVTGLDPCGNAASDVPVLDLDQRELRRARIRNPRERQGALMLTPPTRRDEVAGNAAGRAVSRRRRGARSSR